MSTYASAAAVRAFRIVDILAKAEHPLSLMEIVDKIELPKQTVHRLLKQLVGASLVTRANYDRNYECSPLVRQMAVNLLMTTGPAATRRAILQELVDTVDETCNLTMCSGDSIVYLDRVEVNWPHQFVLTAGSRVPFHCTSSGKLLMSFLPKQQRERLLTQLPLRSSTDQTITNREQLRNELSQIRKDRYSLNRGEFMPGMVAIAVPIMHGKSRACAAISIQTSAERCAPEQLYAFLPQLQAAAQRAAETFL